MSVRVIECGGSRADIGKATGEGLRNEIREHIEMVRSWSGLPDSDRLRRFRRSLEIHLPETLTELAATAAAANVSEDDLLGLNYPFPLHPDWIGADDECTNMVFRGGGDGPIWGKNNDGQKARARPVCLRIVRPQRGIPQMSFSFCGMIAVMDALNAEGVAVGHSSVGSRFQQSDDHPPIRPWAYEALMRSYRTSDFVRIMTSTPLRGKGYSIVCVDKEGSLCSLEAACPLVQVRRPKEEDPAAPTGMCCANHYQLPTLQEADRRTPEGKENSLARQHLIDGWIQEERTCDLERMVGFLRHHGDPSLCRHNPRDLSDTVYSAIGLPREGILYYMEGNPCESELKRLTF